MKHVVVFVWLTLSGASCYKNVACNGRATQSDRHLHNFGGAYSAIDGNRDSNFNAGSCSHTTSSTNPWWRVELCDHYVIEKIIVYNREDCCSERLNRAEVHVGKEIYQIGDTDTRVGIILFSKGTGGDGGTGGTGGSALPPGTGGDGSTTGTVGNGGTGGNGGTTGTGGNGGTGGTAGTAGTGGTRGNGGTGGTGGTARHSSFTIIPATHTSGRYVTIVLLGSDKVLTLCEVEVYGYLAPTGVNLALKGRASQSSLFYYGMAHLAVDGNTDSDFEHASCSHTNNQCTPWWRLDLATTHKVFSVKITNLKNSQYASRLNGAEIRIGDSIENNGNNNPRCAVLENIPAGATVEFQCKGMDGRYVNVVIPHRTEYLTLCEVEVYGSVLD